MTTHNHLNSVEYQPQRECLKELMKPRPTVIGIEGGPCGGKTTLAEKLKGLRIDRPVVVLPEAATPHILKLHEKGLDPGYLAQHDRDGYLAFEKDVLGTIVANIQEALEAFDGSDAIIVADRTDIAAYVTPEEYKEILGTLGLERSPMLDLIDHMYYLPSVARESPELYQGLKDSNVARYETLEEAQNTCTRNLMTVAHHPELRIAWGGYKSFEDKIDTLVDAIAHPEREAEPKIKPQKADSKIVEELLLKNQQLNLAQITQSYFEVDSTVYRLRKTRTAENYILYSFAIKTGEGAEKQEISRRLSAEQYAVLAQAPKVGHQLEKERHSFLMTDADDTSQSTLPATRLWVADHYFDRRLTKWNLETDVYSQQEYDAVLNRMTAVGFEREMSGAEKQARYLGQLAVA